MLFMFSIRLEMTYYYFNWILDIVTLLGAQYFHIVSVARSSVLPYLQITQWVTYQHHSTLIYRTEHYNRVDKINMNNPKIVSPEKTGKNHY